MSKLLNMLTNLNRAPGSNVVPPDIRINVAKNDVVRRSNRTYIICGIVTICAVLSGFGLRIYFEKNAGRLQQNYQSPPPSVAPEVSLPSTLTAKLPIQTSQESATSQQIIHKSAQPVETRSTAKRPAPSVAQNKFTHPGKKVPHKTLGSKKEVATSVPQKTTGSANVAAELALTAKSPPIDHESRNTWLISARSAEKRKAYSEALKLYKKALTFDQENYFIMNNATSMHIHLGEYAAALSMADKALLLAQDYIPALINQGIARTALNNESGASESFSKAMELDPANREAMYNFALFYEKTGKLEASALAFQKLANNGDVQGMIGLARIREKQARGNEAVKIYTEITAMRDIPADARNMAITRLRLLKTHD